MVKRSKGVKQGFKHCPKCKTVKPESKFSKSKAQRDGLQTQCKECRKELRRIIKHKDVKIWRAKYPQKFKAEQLAQNNIPLKDHCEICGCSNKVRKLHRAHFDYDKPLEVHTFCCKCHNI